MRKSAVSATYPLTYLQAFNAAPFERIEVTGMGKNHRTCEDKSTEPSPTCGWHLSARTGERLRDSQGFCCGCSMSNAVDESIDGSIDGSGMSGGAGTEFRARLDCNFFRTGLPLQAAAHCMTHGDEWFSGYAVGAARMDFDIFVDASVGGDDVEIGAGSARNSTLRLGPDVALNRTRDGLVTAELLGDLASYASVPALSEKILLVPPDPSARESWLLLDSSMVTLSGDECDKVGVGFSAFRAQPSRCYRDPGACLRNQITDILEAERDRLARGRQPLYLLSRYGDGAARTVRGDGAAGGVRLSVPLVAGANSVLTLTLDAEDLVQVVNTSPGTIVGAVVSGFTAVPLPLSHANANAGTVNGTSGGVHGGFEALTGSGRIHAEVLNTGHIVAEYRVSLSQCTPGVERIIAPGPVTLLPSQPQTLVLRLDVSSHDADASRACTLTLQDAIGEELDSRVIRFYTNATELDSAPDDVYVPHPKSAFAGANAKRTKLTCADHCPSTITSLRLLAPTSTSTRPTRKISAAARHRARSLDTCRLSVRACLSVSLCVHAHFFCRLSRPGSLALCSRSASCLSSLSLSPRRRLQHLVPRGASMRQADRLSRLPCGHRAFARERPALPWPALELLQLLRRTAPALWRRRSPARLDHP